MYILLAYLNVEFRIKVLLAIDQPVTCLNSTQSQHDELEAKFREERAVLEAKYEKLYQPLYAKVIVRKKNNQIFL